MGHLQYFIKKLSMVDMFVWTIYSHENCLMVARAHITTSQKYLVVRTTLAIYQIFS